MDRDARTTEVVTSSTFNREKTETERCTPVSHRADQSKASFLDLPPEIRNHIYSQLLISDDYIRPTTSVPCLHLLKICKQLHDEAASVFYAANSFYCHWETKTIAYENAPFDAVNFPKIAAPWLEGLIWPAPRYHVYLTRVVIDARVEIVAVDSLATISNSPGQRERTVRTLEVELRKRFSKLHIELAELWAAKDRPWSGSLICVRPRKAAYISSSTFLNAVLAFSEADEEVTKVIVRGYQQLG
ncbi:uncharacterized protein BDZ99DRAFT_543350 [Mytilinidion resinicola]|uniref:F-box domain-containing protein n=1 Tax=Mytilinidion resinicola TaxID=574789 RepID=A0A6A6Z8N4_9PEZI|nr:uncharacterized protein BDZ99DRAFT_543350 [Mytilinidion resinicola]KAF2816654.1 hypothetical protein BDZ99DRAFT_543350 [Mytilinidion resinicola]